jgi:YegS/Rv2252/BmrU family lipid kinase
MSKRDWLVLVNPAAGRRPVTEARIAGALSAAEVEAEIFSPWGVGEMRAALLAAADAGRRRFAVVGGDGTANLVVNVLLERNWYRPPVLAILPSGTGCDLLRTFGIPQSLAAAAAHLRGDSTYRIDVGVLEGHWGRRHFINVAQAGIGAAAAEAAVRLPRSLGKARYPLAFAMRLPGFPVAEVELEDAQRTRRSSALAVIMANAQFFAGGWNVAPRASAIDGLLDVQVINARKTEAPRLVPKIVRGVHLGDRAVRRWSGASFELRTSTPWPVEADGDAVGNTPVRVSVRPLAIDIKI